MICPYFIMAGRFGLDCNLMLGMSPVFLYCFICAIESERISRYILAGVTGGLVLYTYAMSYLAVPIFLVLALIYIIRVKSFFLKGWIVMAIPMRILAAPLILVKIVNIFDLAQFQIGCFTITKMELNRATQLGGFSFKSLCSVIGVILLGDTWEYNTAPGYSNCYGVTILFFLLGAGLILRAFWKSARDRKLNSQTFLLLWLVGMVLLGTISATNVNRMNGVFYCVVFFAAVGIDGLIRKLRKYSAVAGILIVGIYLACFGKFANYYFGGTYTDSTFPIGYFDVPVAEATNFIEQDSSLNKKTTQMAEKGVYYALGTLKSPYELNMREIDLENKTDNYIFGALGEIEDQYNYIVLRSYTDYMEELRAAGFSEEYYGDYSLFYKK